MYQRHRRLIHIVSFIVFATVLLYGVVLFTQFLLADQQANAFVNQYGYWAVLVASYVAGLNAIVPIPATSLVPVFLAADLWLPLIIAILVIGTTLADLTAFGLAVLGRKAATGKFPKVEAYARKLHEKKEVHLAIFVFVYATISPLPNEIILVPLALAGVKLRVLILPLIVGTIIYQTYFSLTMQGVFNFFVGG